MTDNKEWLENRIKRFDEDVKQNNIKFYEHHCKACNGYKKIRRNFFCDTCTEKKQYEERRKTIETKILSMSDEVLLEVLFMLDKK